MTNLSLKIKSSLMKQESSNTNIVTSFTAPLNLAAKPTMISEAKGMNKSSKFTKNIRPAKILEISKVGIASAKDKKVSIMPSKGAKRMLTEYQAQFKAKQTIKKYYGNLSENEWKNLCKAKMSSATLDLEKRLDVVIFRLGFARSILEARTLIKEKQVKLNDKLVNPVAYNQLIKLGSKITIEPSNKTYLAKIKHLKLNCFASKLPTHLHLASPTIAAQLSSANYSSESFSGYFLKTPLESEIIYPYNFPLAKLAKP